MKILTAVCLMACLSPIAQAQPMVAGVPIPANIESDPAAAALFPYLIGYRTAEICHDRGDGISDEQLETLTIAIGGYAESLGITKVVEAAVREFASAIVDRQADELSPAEWKGTNCAAVAGDLLAGCHSQANPLRERASIALCHATLGTRLFQARAVDEAIDSEPNCGAVVLPSYGSAVGASTALLMDGPLQPTERRQVPSGASSQRLAAFFDRSL